MTEVAVESWTAPAVLSILAVATEVHDGRLREVPVDGLSLTRVLRALWQRRRRLPEPAAILVRQAEASGNAVPR